MRSFANGPAQLKDLIPGYCQRKQRATAERHVSPTPASWNAGEPLL